MTNSVTRNVCVYVLFLDTDKHFRNSCDTRYNDNPYNHEFLIKWHQLRSWRVMSQVSTIFYKIH